MGTYLDLERRLSRFRKGHAKPGEKHKKTQAPTPPVTNGNGKAKASSYRVRAFNAPVSYRVSGIVPPLRQPTGMTCWATVSTMMMSWRENASMTIDTAMGTIGSQYLAKFQANQGLGSAEKGPFLAAAGLVAEPPMSYSIEGWLQLLRTYGPIWVTTDEDPSANFAIHARIMVGIEGDGTPDGTSFRIVDPGTGTEYSEGLTTFIQKYQEEARALRYDQPLRIQVVHWPANSQSQGQSYGRVRAQSYTSRSLSSSWRTSRAFDDAGAPDAGADAGTSAPLAWGARVSAEFRVQVRNISNILRCDPNHLMAAMAFETGETFSPSIRNRTSGATGLIQFMPRTAQRLGTTTDALAQMTAVQQIDYVQRYLQPFAGRLNTLEDVYMAILWPAAVGQADSTVLMSRDSSSASNRRAYEQNQGLDADRDGRITRGEAAEPVRRKLARGTQQANYGGVAKSMSERGPFSRRGPFIDVGLLPPVAGLEVPTVGPHEYVLVDGDERVCRVIGDRELDASYVDNNIETFKLDGVDWLTLDVDKEAIKIVYFNGSAASFPLGWVSLEAGRTADQYYKTKGVIYPIDNAGALLLNATNTPNLVRIRRWYHKEARRVNDQRIQIAEVVHAFAEAIGALGNAGSELR